MVVWFLRELPHRTSISFWLRQAHEQYLNGQQRTRDKWERKSLMRTAELLEAEDDLRWTRINESQTGLTMTLTATLLSSDWSCGTRNKRIVITVTAIMFAFHGLAFGGPVL
jgi:hypothetical protein